MSKIELTRSVFQAALSKFTADRDDALSKINRALSSLNDPNVDVEKVVTSNLERLAIAKISIMMSIEELENLLLSNVQINKENNDDNNS